jgi:transketolase
MTPDEVEALANLARQLRVDSIRCTTAVGAGHPTSSLSAADLLAVLVTRHLHYDWSEPKRPENDHLIFSKGHASPLLYSVFRAVGVVSEDELLQTYRRFGARLQGHPTPVLPWVDLATGSLGLGVAAAVGVGIAGKYLDELPYRIFALCGDSETAEGSVWEAFDKAAYYELSNFTAIVDVNRLGQRGPTELGWDLDAYAARVSSFGCHPIVIDGHDLEQIDAAFSEARSSAHPSVILARTVKGKGVPEIEDKNGWHGTALPADMAERAIAALGGPSSIVVTSPKPDAGTPAITPNPQAKLDRPHYAPGDKVATRSAYGDALVALSARPEVVVLDAEVGNSTHSEAFEKVAPKRYFEAFISEQLMVGAACGLAVRRYVPFAATFGAFFSRAYDFVRMAGISDVAIHLCGSHSGVEIGSDGPSQMALEDLAEMRAINDSTVLYPCDAPSTVALVLQNADRHGVSYVRTTRGAYPVLYSQDEEFPIGGAKVLRSGPADVVTLVGAGVTVHESLAAADQLAADGIATRVVDCYSVKPIDQATLVGACQATAGRIVVTEDHYPAGGLGEAVLSALTEARVNPRFAHLAVAGLSQSGTPAELLDAAGISAGHIAKAARALLDE